MWITISAASTTPVTQWMSSHSNLMPRIGRNAVAMSTRTQMAISQ